MGGEDDPEDMARLRLLAPTVAEILFMLAVCSQLSSVPGIRGILGAEFVATIEPERGVLDAFPLVTGLGHMVLLSSRLLILEEKNMHQTSEMRIQEKRNWQKDKILKLFQLLVLQICKLKSL